MSDLWRDFGTTDTVIRRTMSSTVGDDVVEVIVGDGRNLITVIVIIMKANSACDRVDYESQQCVRSGCNQTMTS